MSICVQHGRVYGMHKSVRQLLLLYAQLTCGTASTRLQHVELDAASESAIEKVEAQVLRWAMKDKLVKARCLSTIGTLSQALHHIYKGAAVAKGYEQAGVTCDSWLLPIVYCRCG